MCCWCNLLKERPCLFISFHCAKENVHFQSSLKHYTDEMTCLCLVFSHSLKLFVTQLNLYIAIRTQNTGFFSKPNYAICRCQGEYEAARVQPGSMFGIVRSELPSVLNISEPRCVNTKCCNQAPTVCSFSLGTVSLVGSFREHKNFLFGWLK